MQQLRRLNFFDRSIVERTRPLPLITNGSGTFRSVGGTSAADMPCPGQTQQHAGATGIPLLHVRRLTRMRHVGCVVFGLVVA